MGNSYGERGIPTVEILKKKNVEIRIKEFSINTQVIIQNHAVLLARYLGLSADNHLDGQNGCQ